MWSKTLIEFAGLLGFAALVAITINVLKIIKIKGKPIVAEDAAQKWNLGFNLVGLVALYVFRLFKPEVPVTGLDSVLMEIATVISYIFSIVSQFAVTKFTNYVVRGMPLIGKSYSLDREISSRNTAIQVE